MVHCGSYLRVCAALDASKWEMKAIIEIYEDRKSIIKITQNSGVLIDRYEVSAIAVEMPRGISQQQIRKGQYL